MSEQVGRKNYSVMDYTYRFVVLLDGESIPKTAGRVQQQEAGHWQSIIWEEGHTICEECWIRIQNA